jgi:subtilisin family serine protease
MESLIMIAILLPAITTVTLAKDENRVIIGFVMDDKVKMTHQFVVNLLKEADVKCKVLHVDGKLNFAVITTREDIEVLRNKLLKHAEIEFIEIDHTFKAIGSIEYIPNDPYFGSQWGLASINVTSAWDIETGNQSIIVAVIDTGVDYTHPDLAANYLPAGYDFVNDDADPLDDNGHGTHVAGIIAAVMNNSEGIAGIAQVKIMAEKVLDSSGTGYSSWVARGIAHAADSNANVISMSLGSLFPSSVIQRACTYAWKKGSLLVAASGNDGLGRLNYPAAYRTVMAVGAIDDADNLAWFSNYGRGLELTAPGVDIISTYPTGYAVLSGTSMATPHVSGVAALVWSANPSLTNLQVRKILDSTAIDLGIAGYDAYYGFGKIDAYRALNQAI